MAVKVNGAGRAYARSLVAAGKVDKTSAWSWDDAKDGNALLGPDRDNWDNYGRHHLAVDSGENDKTKGHWKYPFAKGGVLYRSALVAIRDRAAQQGVDDVFDAAGALLHEIDAAKDDDKGGDGGKGSRLLTPRDQLFAQLILAGESRILAIDDARALHQAREDANAVRAPTQVAVVPLMGALFPRGRYGGSMEAFRGALAQAVANPDVGAIVLDVDSPGGTYAGTPETAAAVRAAAQVKPVTAVVDSLCASAAYYIASQAAQLVVTPSAEVGSIGTLAIHADFSQAYEREGIAVTIIRDPPFKAEGNPFEPLSDEARAHLQGDVSGATADFHRAVAQGRRVSLTKVREDFGKGRTVGAHRAVELGMADRVGSMSDVLAAARTRHAYRRRSSLAFR